MFKLILDKHRKLLYLKGREILLKREREREREKKKKKKKKKKKLARAADS